MSAERIDPFAPPAMAARAAAGGAAKTRLDTVSLFALAVLAGVFIALGAQLATIAGVAPGVAFGPVRLLIGLAFSLGLILVVLGGAELFTGNMLVVISRLTRAVTTRAVLRNWTIAYGGNFVGAVATAVLVYASGQWALAGGRVGAAALEIAHAKVSLGFVEALARGVLGNGLVCLAVWLCFSARSDVDKTKIAFYGLSLGAQLGPVYLAIEPRLRTGVLLSGGFEIWTIPPESDPVSFTPRVRQPVIMVNGREDFDLPYASAQLPMFRMLGTPAADKAHVVLEGGHLPPKPQEVFKVILDWLDKYLGPVGR